ncbi:MAG: YraN family protein [Oscillospiraceae bacterium]|nr:YraN family protein [Oscillospiraceae bacterium]
MGGNSPLGRWGEEKAAAYLRRLWYRIVEKNYTTRFGEIDLIAKNSRYLVFVEVKLRKNDAYGAARDFVTAAKQERLRKTAELWLGEHPTSLQPRFDVIEIYAPYGSETRRPKIVHLRDAF